MTAHYDTVAHETFDIGAPHAVSQHLRDVPKAGWSVFEDQFGTSIAGERSSLVGVMPDEASADTEVDRRNRSEARTEFEPGDDRDGIPSLDVRFRSGGYVALKGGKVTVKIEAEYAASEPPVEVDEDLIGEHIEAADHERDMYGDPVCQPMSFCKFYGENPSFCDRSCTEMVE